MPLLVASNMPAFVIEVPSPPMVRVLLDELALTVPLLARDKFGYTELAFDPISPDPEIVLWLVSVAAALFVPI